MYLQQNNIFFSFAFVYFTVLHVYSVLSQLNSVTQLLHNAFCNQIILYITEHVHVFAGH